MYNIKKLQYRQAKLLGVTIKPSQKKKIDVFNKEGKKIASIGGVRPDGTFYNDYATYINKIGKEKADIKRKNYLNRHKNEPKEKNGKKTNSYWSDVILWGNK